LKKTLTIRIGDDADRSAPKPWALTGDRLERLKTRARDERRTPTDAELQLWNRLSGGQVGGLKFTRKVIVGPVLATFACPSRWIVVNLTPADASAEVNALQDRKLTDAGLRVLRFDEADVLTDIETVLDAIKAEVNKPFDKKAAQRDAAAQISSQFERSEG